MRLKIVLMSCVASLSFAGGSGAYAQDFDPFDFADADHDGKVTQAEYAVFREGGWNYVMNGAESVKAADQVDMAKVILDGTPVDAKGMATHAAYTAASATMFKKADKNNDGFLDAAEIRATMPAN
ncbi:hypothetical protein [Glacieibacterium sp.]|uniref:hypothetical protein n=1 Tax=Glacieibacterium sp. TaxID=2860237 RepID=UPI003B00B08B